MKPSGIGGQAVMEGIMMRNKSVYSVAVRKPDNEIEIMKKESKLLTQKYKFLNFPIIRGIFNFVESLVIGMSTLTYSASFYEDPKEQEATAVDNFAKAVFKERLDSVIMAITVLVSIAFAMGLFMILPFFVSRTLSKFVVSAGALNLIEGLIRVMIFILYMVLISFMEDIRRVYMYHGAEHKCINCIENGLELTIENVRKSSRMHKRCGTSFLFLVMLISVVFFIFIRVSNPLGQIGIRLLLVPVIAGVSYELIQWAGKNDNRFVSIVSKPGMWLQALTTREPDDSMIEVAIKAVEEVFDWKQFLAEYNDGNETVEAVEKVTDSDESDKTAAVVATEISDELRGIDAIEEDLDLEDLMTIDGANASEIKEFASTNNQQESLRKQGNADVLEELLASEAEESQDEDDDFGISFLDESEDNTEAKEVPIFKNRKTDI